jgi:hypothetical protein
MGLMKADWRFSVKGYRRNQWDSKGRRPLALGVRAARASWGCAIPDA